MFVRGISNITNIERIKDSVGETVVGAAVSELRTNNDTLSVWHIENKDDFLDAALSIVLPRDDFGKASFMIIDEKILQEQGIQYKQEAPLKEYVNDSKATHYDLIGVRVSDIENILSVYKTVYDEEKEYEEETNIVTWPTSQTKKNILNAAVNGRICMESLAKKMRESIEKNLEHSDN